MNGFTMTSPELAEYLDETGAGYNAPDYFRTSTDTPAQVWDSINEPIALLEILLVARPSEPRLDSYTQRLRRYLVDILAIALKTASEPGTDFEVTLNKTLEVAVGTSQARAAGEPGVKLASAKKIHAVANEVGAEKSLVRGASLVFFVCAENAPWAAKALTPRVLDLGYAKAQADALEEAGLTGVDLKWDSPEARAASAAGEVGRDEMEARLAGLIRTIFPNPFAG